MTTLEQRFSGCLLGLAVGDAVGTTLEFRTKDSYEHITDMVGGGPFRLKPGEWTDDTSMALCLATSLIECKGFNAKDQMERYCRWRDEGYMSSNGRCFDIGGTVNSALNRYVRSGEPYSGSTDEQSAGNGSLMRLAPVTMYYHPNLENLIHYSGESSRTTHGAEECVEACKYYASLLLAAFNGEDKESILTSTYYTPTTPKIAATASGAYRNKPRGDIFGTGYVVDALEAALWCFDQTDNFEAAILLAANLGDDADTTAAICGQLAGAFYGVNNIPQNWLDKCVMHDEIANLASALSTSHTKNLYE